MAKEIINEIVDKKDYEAISKIAAKYSMSVEAFCRLLSKKFNAKQLASQVRFSPEEIQKVDNRASKIGVNRSKYCRLCYKKALKDELYKNFEILDAMRSPIKRDVVVNISFDDAEEFKEMKALAKKFSVPFANLLRYFSLNIEL